MLTLAEQQELAELFKIMVALHEYKKKEGVFRFYFETHYKFVRDKIKALSEKETFNNDTNYRRKIC